jgi:hypothetical protein
MGRNNFLTFLGETKVAKLSNKEPVIVAVAETMVSGLMTHTDVDVADLQDALNNYKNHHQNLKDAENQAKIATTTKVVILENLVELMRNHLKLSEFNVANSPEKLTEIELEPGQDSQSIIAPDIPTELHTKTQGLGTIWLKWNKSADSNGGPVRNYIIERRHLAEGSKFGAWALAKTTYICEIYLSDQPADVRIEYRVKAANAAGESLPSNSVSVVLS